MVIYMITSIVLLIGFASATLSFSKNIFLDPFNDRPYLPLQNSYFLNMSYVWLLNESDGKIGLVQIPPPLLKSEKHSLSMMFWPVPMSNIDLKTLSTCKTSLGLNSLNSSSISQDVQLINSFLYTETLRTSYRGYQETYFISVSLDKTSSSNSLSVLVSGNFSEKHKNGFTCDNILQIDKRKFYIFCWRALEVEYDSSKREYFKLHIVSMIWGPFMDEEIYNSGFFVHMTKEDYDRFIDIKGKTLNTIALKSLEKDSIEVAFYFKHFNMFIVSKMADDKFKSTIYPRYLKENEKDFMMKPLKEENGEAYNLYTVELVSNYKFLLSQSVQKFDQYNEKTYAKLYFFDAGSDLQPVFVGKGMALSFKKSLDSNSELSASEVLLIMKAIHIKNANPSVQDNMQVLIQRRIYYQGYFYGNQEFNMTIKGQPRNLNVIFTKDFIIYVDYLTEKNPMPECGGPNIYLTRLRIAPIDRPDAHRPVLELEKVVGIKPRLLVSTNNNIVWVRFAHKLEVYDLVDIGIDFAKKNTGLNISININPSEFESTLRMLVTKEPIYPENDLQLLSEAQYYHFKPKVTSIFESTTNSKPSITRNKTVNLTLFYPFRKFSFLGSLSDMVSGNYLSYDPNPDSPSMTSMLKFENKYSFMKNTGDKKIKKIYCIDYLDDRYIIISYGNHGGNSIYKYNPRDQTKKIVMDFYDNRTIDHIQKLSSKKYLLHIEGLLYELDITKLELEPVFRSKDLCGELYAMVQHDIYGVLTLCAGKDELNLFASADSENEKTDLSSPLLNVYVAPTLKNTLKSEGVGLVISDPSFPNRFITVSRQEINNNLNIIREWKYRVRVRVYEIGFAGQIIDIMAEHEEWVAYDDAIQSMKGHIVANRVILFTSHQKIESVKEVIKVYTITTSFSLVHDKTLEIPSNFLLNVHTYGPLSTYLPVKKTLLSSTNGSRILLLVSIISEKEDVLENFDFFNFNEIKKNNKAKSKRNALAIFDPLQTSLDCFKFFDLQGDYEPFAFGHYFIGTNSNRMTQGAIIAGTNGEKTRISFFKDHSFMIEFYSVQSREGFFDSPRIDNLKFNFYIKNYLTNERRMIWLNLFPKTNIDGLKNMVAKKDHIDIKLTEEKDHFLPISLLIRSNSTSGQLEDMVEGCPYKFTFNFDSQIEKEGQLINLRNHEIFEEYPQSVINSIVQMMSFKPGYDLDLNAFTISRIERIYPLQPEDYADLLFASEQIVFPLTQTSKSSKSVRENPDMMGKTRCTKFFLQETVKDPVKENVACIGLNTDQFDKMKSIDIFVYDERKEPDLYSMDTKLKRAARLELKTPTPFKDLVISSTLNHVMVFYSVSKTVQTYHFEVFRVSKNKISNLFECFSIVNGDVWSTDLEITSSFIKPHSYSPDNLERICAVSTGMLESVLLNYFCFNYTFTGVEISEAVQFKRAAIFDTFDYEDMRKVPIKLLIYEPVGNPTAVDTMVVEDQMLYFIFSLPSHYSVFARLNPDLPSEASNTDKGFEFAILCNAFQGFRFVKEMHVASERFYSKIYVDTTRTIVSLYNLPSIYAKMNLRKYEPMYTENFMVVSKILNTDSQLSCIEQKYMKIIEFQVDSVRKIKFNDQPISTLRQASFRGIFDKSLRSSQRHVNTAQNLGKPSLIFEKDALMLMFISGKRFYRFEYLPTLEFISTASYLSSNYIDVVVSGMYNTSTNIRLNLISGKFTEVLFVLTYLLPLVILAILICVMNYSINFVYSRVHNEGRPEDQANASSIDLESVFSTGLLSAVGSGGGKFGDLASFKGDKERKPTTPGKELNMLETPLQDNPGVRFRDSGETGNERQIRHNLIREAGFMKSIGRDADFLLDLESINLIKELYKEGVFVVDSEKRANINEVIVREGERSIIKIAEEEEENFILDEVKLEEYKVFKEYMDNRRAEDRLKNRKKSVKKKLTMKRSSTKAPPKVLPKAPPKALEVDKDSEDLSNEEEEGFRSNTILKRDDSPSKQRYEKSKTGQSSGGEDSEDISSPINTSPTQTKVALPVRRRRERR